MITAGRPRFKAAESARAPQRNGKAVSKVAEDELCGMAIDIATAPPDLVEETVRLCAQRACEMLHYEVVDQAEVGDALWNACEAAGLVQARGADAVQKLLADALSSPRPDDAVQDASALDEGGQKEGGARRTQATALIE